MTDSRLFPVVAGALIDAAGRVLLQRRPPGKPLAGLWEFPGGKVEPGESPEAALVRELDEELGVAVSPATLKPVSFASVAQDGRHLLLLLYLARDWHGEPQAKAADALCWARPDEMANLAMPSADVPLVAALARLMERDGTGGM